MNRLTAFQRDILYVIAGLHEPYGLEIKEVIEGYYESEVNHGRLYPNLDTLVDEGFLTKGSLDKRTNSYTLTQQAHESIQTRRDWENQNLSDEASDLGVILE